MPEPASPDPHDPLAPRPDDPWIGRWWWWVRLSGRDGKRHLIARWPILVTLMMVLLGLVALAVVLARAA